MATVKSNQWQPNAVNSVHPSQCQATMNYEPWYNSNKCLWPELGKIESLATKCSKQCACKPLSGNHELWTVIQQQQMFVTRTWQHGGPQLLEPPAFTTIRLNATLDTANCNLLHTGFSQQWTYLFVPFHTA